MEIKYFGWESFRLQEGKSTIITQPFSKKKTGISFPKTKADIVLSFPGGKNDWQQIEGGEKKTPFVVTGPGEYEIGGVDVWGFPGGYWLEVRGISVAFWWGEEEMVKKLVSSFSGIDILLFRADGKGTDSGKKIRRIVEKISPSIVIPFVSGNISREEMAKDEWAKPFLDALDREDVKGEDKLLVKSEDISGEETKVVLLKAKF